MQATGTTSWREEVNYKSIIIFKGIKYKRNEVFLDIIESVNVVLSNKGTILRNDVQGLVKVKC